MPSSLVHLILVGLIVLASPSEDEDLGLEIESRGLGEVAVYSVERRDVLELRISSRDLIGGQFGEIIHDRLASLPRKDPKRVLLCIPPRILDFDGLAMATRIEVLKRSGGDARQKYNRLIQMRLDSVLRVLREQCPDTELSVLGLPLRGGSESERGRNKDLDSVTQSLDFLAIDQFVLARSGLVNASLFRASHESVFAMAGRRDVYVRAAGGWACLKPGSAVIDPRPERERSNSLGRDEVVVSLGSEENSEPQTVAIKVPAEGLSADGSGTGSSNAMPPGPHRGGGGGLGSGGASGSGSAMGSGGAIGAGSVVAPVGPAEDIEPAASGSSEEATPPMSQGSGDEDDPYDSSNDADLELRELEHGSGFLGATQVEHVGAPGDFGGSYSAIARWNVVPYQVLDSFLEVGVVAFHINGIEKVEFSVEGGPWLAIDQMSVNPRTGSREYWCRVGPSAGVGGWLELRARVIPAGAGVTTVLQDDPASGLGDRVVDEEEGIHSMWLYAGGGEPAECYLSVYGNDLASGSREQPVRTLAEALGRLAESESLADARVVILAPGEYELPGSNGLVPEFGWIRIEAESSLPPDAVRLVAPGYLSTGQRARFRPFISRAWWKNVTFDWGTITQYYTETEDFVVFEGCLWTDREGRTRLWTEDGTGYQMIPVRACRGLYAIQSEVRNMFWGLVGFDIVRGCVINEISADALTNTSMSLDTVIRDFDRDVFPWFHCDVFQFWGHRRNVIAFGVRAFELNDIQSFLLDGTNSSFENFAFVDVAFENNLDTVPISQVASSCTHVLFLHMALVGQRMQFNDHFPPESSAYFRADGVRIQNSLLKRVDRGTWGAIGPADGLMLYNCHLVEQAFVDFAASNCQELTSGPLNFDIWTNSISGASAGLVAGAAASIPGLEEFQSGNLGPFEP